MALATVCLNSEARATVACRVCDSPRYRPYLQGRGCDIVQCLGCGLRYINPQPTDIELRDFYAQFDSHSTWRGDGEERFDRAMRDIVLQFKRSGTMLDIGSSRGNFLLAMRAAGFDVCGVEPSPQNSEFARRTHQVETYTATAEQFLSAPSKVGFDVVTMLNVLEHVKDPKQVLNQVKRIMSRDGVLVLVVPDARLHATVGRTRQLLGRPDPFWMAKESRPLVGFDPPAHICSFEPKIIRRLVDSCGFHTLSVRNAPIIVTRDKWKNLLKPIFYACSQALYHLSFHQSVLGYSTVLVARNSPA